MTEADQPPLLLVVMPGSGDGHGHAKRAFVAPSKGGRIDYSAPFALIAGTTIFLVVLVLGASALLFSIGDTALPSTLTLAVGGRKHD